MKKRISAVCAAVCAVFLSVSAFAQTMYAPDGRTAEVAESDVQAWQNVGWYTYPVMNVYAPDGRIVPIATGDLQDWQSVGWYAYPVMNVYAPDGRIVPIATSDLQDWQSVGWYAYPVMNVYAPDGRVVPIAKSDWDSWSKVGWYATAAEAQSKNTSYSGGGTSSGSGGTWGGRWYGGTSAQTEETAGIVYKGKTGTKYHKKNCKTLKGGGYPISYEEAIKEGRTAGKVCGG